MPEITPLGIDFSAGIFADDHSESFRFLTDYIPQQLWTAAPDGLLRYVNKQTTEYFGKTQIEILTEGWEQLVHPDDLDHCLSIWKQAIECGQPCEMQVRLQGADGTYKWHLGRATPYLNNGRILHWLGTNTDIDAQKKTEEKKDDFINITSHELRNPLTSAKAYLQLAFRQVGENNKALPLLTKGLQQINRMQHLINNLLDVSKINTGKIIYENAPFNFGELLRETVDSIQQITLQHKITIQGEIPEIIYQGDRLRIEQVITNLLSNAIKYSPDADKIIVSCFVQQNNLIVSVQDFGIGIEKENLSQLFDRYYRTENNNMRYEGLGLGLYISSEIIKRHHGSFWIESEPGKGSTFYFLLPIDGKQELTDLDSDNQTFYKSNFIEMFYVAEKHRIEVNWLGYQNFESVRKGCLMMMDLLEKNRCSKVLNDNTNVLGNWSEASDWLGEYWFPAMQHAGLQQFAWVYSPSTFSRMAAHKSIDVMLGTITARFFTDKESAAKWLEAE